MLLGAVCEEYKDAAIGSTGLDNTAKFQGNCGVAILQSGAVINCKSASELSVADLADDT